MTVMLLCNQRPATDAFPYREKRLQYAGRSSIQAYFFLPKSDPATHARGRVPSVLPLPIECRLTPDYPHGHGGAAALFVDIQFELSRSSRDAPINQSPESSARSHRTVPL